MTIELHYRTELAAPPDEVWPVVSTMAGVNAELGPWVRMTHPDDVDDLTAADVVPGEPVFASWLLAFGFVPVDRHRLTFEAIHERGFDEQSTSLLQRSWRHERRVLAAGAGSTVTDHLVAAPRLGWAEPLTRRLVGAVFRHRHRRLVRRFGSLR